MEVRALGPEELFRLRQEASRTDPFAFLASPEEDVLSSVAETRRRLAGDGAAAVFGAIDRDLVGMLGLFREPHRKAAHKAVLWGFYVRLEARGRGAGARLIGAALDHARGLDGIVLVHLGVSETAVAARCLYERAGFQAWGQEPQAFRHDDRFVDQCHMWRSLTND